MTSSTSIETKSDAANQNKSMTDAERSDAIKRQVEYYLSRQNLMQDTYLLSKMDKNHFVDISVIAEFKLVKQLTTDVDVILSAITSSDKIVVDESNKKVKPLAIKERTTLILRNIPSSASEESVKELLKSANVPELLSIRADVGNNWFITFANEDTTKNAMEIAKTLKWEGKQIGCAIKSESLLMGLAMGPPKIDGATYQTNGEYANNGHVKQHRAWNGPTHGRRPHNAPAEAHDASKRTSGNNGIKKKQPRNPRENTHKDGSPTENRNIGTRKDAVQAALNLSDFPTLSAAVTKPKSPTNAEAISAANTPPLCTTPPLCDAPASGSGDEKKEAGASKNIKISYAQMALASMNNNNAATATSA